MFNIVARAIGVAALGARPPGGPPEAVTKRMVEDKATWGPIIKSANIVLP